MNVIEDLRRSISNTEKRAIPMNEDMPDIIETEATEVTLHDTLAEVPPKQIEPQQLDSRQANPEQVNPPTAFQPIPQQPTPRQPISRQPIPQHTVSQKTAPQQTVPQKTVLPQAATQSAIATHHRGQPPPSPNDKVAQSGPVVVKTESLDEDQLDFAFAAEILTNWNPNEEGDAALWERMKTTVRSPVVSGIRVADRLPATMRYRIFVGGIL